MQVQSSLIKEVCSKLLNALDSDSVSTITETLDLRVENNVLILSITNMEYIVKTKIVLSSPEVFHATVHADIFLKLINQVTTDQIELTIDNNILIIKGNGTYKLPMIYENDDLISLPDIQIDSVDYECELNTEILNNIVNYNSKELTKGLVGSPVQKLYYLDNKGCITFTTGACITEFNLPINVQILLNSKIVKLFKLFTTEKVYIKIGTEVISEISQTKISLSNDTVEIVSITPSTPDMINMVPKDNIRNMATTQYKYKINISTIELKDCINRLLLFMPTSLYLQPYGQFEFENSHLSIYDKSKNNVETISYTTSDAEINDVILLDLNDVKSVLDNVKEDTITLKFGNHQAVVIEHPGVYNIIPECVI